MKSIDERLAQSDPAAGATYAHPNFDAMMSRVLATPRPRRDAAWRAFRVRVASSVAAATLLTGGGIAALTNAGNALPVLGFAAPTHTKSAAVPASGAFGTMMRINANYVFTGADALSSATSSATVYSLSPPSDAVATLAAAATTLGVTVDPATSSDNGQSYSAPGTDFTGWLVNDGGFFSWGFDSNQGSTVTSSGTSVASDAFNARSVSLAHQLGTFDLGTPTASALGADGSSPVQVNVPILVGGQATDFSYSFTFAPDGTLTNASGVSFSATPTGDYPLVSPAAGVGEITDQLGFVNPFYNAGGIAPMNASSTGASSGPSASATSDTSTTTTLAVSPPPDTSSPGTPPSPPTDTTPTTAPDTTTTTMPPTVVDITSATIQYSSFNMTDGTTLLLPIYVYVGNVTGDNTYQVTFRIVAVDPAYLDLSKVVHVIMY